MKRRGFIFLSLLLAATAGGLSFLGRGLAIRHVERWTGRTDLGFVSCSHCHLSPTGQLAYQNPHPHHPSPVAMAVSADGTRLWIAIDDTREIAEVEVAALRVIRRVQLDAVPAGLALDGAGRTLYVSCRDQAQVRALAVADLIETARVSVGTMPLGLAWGQTGDGERIVVANSGSDDISILGTAPLREVVRVGGGREPAAVTLAADGQLAFIANRLAISPRFDAVPAAEMTVIEPAKGRVKARVRLDSGHLSEGIAAVDGRGWAVMPFVKVRNLVPITQVAYGWVMSSGLAIRTKDGKGLQIPLDEANNYFPDPSGVVVDPAGTRAFVASGGADVVSVVNLAKVENWLARASEEARLHAIEDLCLAPEYVEARLATGRNPKALALSPDGRRLFVAEHLDDAVLVIDAVTLRELGRVRLGDGGLSDPIRRGERVFTQAKFTFQKQFSCRSCHPDGHVDGLSYDFDSDGVGDNLLDNRSLQGVAGTGPFKWNGKNSSLEMQCGPRFAKVLMRTDPIPAGDLRDLTTFLESQSPPTHRRAGQPLTPAQERGRQIFFATKTTTGKPIPLERQCQTCHRPPLYTNRLKSAIGTRGPHDSTEYFDTPHLLGVAFSAPYLHDGRARTLEELWTTYQTNDLHGVSSYMDKHQLNDLVEFLKTL